MIKVYHHNDPDGYCSKFWFSHFHELYFSNEEVNYEEYNYQSIDVKDINNSLVYFLDCSPSRQGDVADLKKQGNRIIIIDHHVTAYDKYSGDADIELFYDVKHSGCELTRLYFEDKFKIKEEYYYFSRMVEDWDIWRFAEDYTEEFIFGLQAGDVTDMELWKDLYSRGFSGVQNCVTVGKSILKFRDNMAALAIKRTGMEVDFHGFTCFALNNALPSSKWFLDNSSKYDCMLNWCVNKFGKVSASLYSEYPEKVKAGKLLEKHYGGGGHDGAAGCTIDIDVFFDEILIFKKEA